MVTESSKFVIKLNRTQSELTLQDVKELRLNATKSYSLPNFALMYGALQGGSVVLTWFIPSSITPQLVRDVKMGGSGFLKEHNITEVSIDGHSVAIVDSNGRIWNLVPSITTPVHFWTTTYAYFLQPGKDIIYHVQGLLLKLRLPSGITRSPKIHGCQCLKLLLVLS